MLHAVTPQLWAAQGFDWGVLGIYWSAALTLGGVIYAATRTAKSAKEANAVTFSKTLLERIEGLEDDIKELRASQQKTASILSVWTVFTENLFRWGRGGGGEPEPTIPAQLREQLAHLIHDYEES